MIEDYPQNNKGGKLKLARIFSAGDQEHPSNRGAKLKTEMISKGHHASQARLRNPKNLKASAENISAYRPVTAKYSVTSTGNRKKPMPLGFTGTRGLRSDHPVGTLRPSKKQNFMNLMSKNQDDANDNYFSESQRSPNKGS